MRRESKVQRGCVISIFAKDGYNRGKKTTAKILQNEVMSIVEVTTEISMMQENDLTTKMCRPYNISKLE